MIHIPSQHLVADFLTKPIGVAARWQHFFAAMGMKPMVEASSESLGSKVARIAALVGGLAGVMTWRPSGPTGKAAQSLAVAAMVASLATSWKAGCDSKKRATGPTRNEYVDVCIHPPYGLQDQVREDEPTCSRDVGSEEEPITEPSPEGSRDYAVEMRHGGNTKRARLAALRGGSSAELGGESSTATGTAPAVDYDRPWTWRRFSMPSRGQDWWDRLPRGWWVRHHVRQRMRPFHPVHRRTPMDCSHIQDRRIIVLWCHGERVIRDDDWRVETQPPAKDAWVGYTFFRELNPDPTAGTLTSTSSSSTTRGQGDRTSSSMSSSLTSGPPPMPGIAEHSPVAEGLPQDVRLDRQGREPDPGESVSDLSTRMTEGMSSSGLGGYGQRLRGHRQRGEVEGSGTSGDSRELSLVSEEIDRGWDYDPAYWAQGPGGQDGTTLMMMCGTIGWRSCGT